MSQPLHNAAFAELIPTPLSSSHFGPDRCPSVLPQMTPHKGSAMDLGGVDGPPVNTALPLQIAPSPAFNPLVQQLATFNYLLYSSLLPLTNLIVGHPPFLDPTRPGPFVTPADQIKQNNVIGNGLVTSGYRIPAFPSMAPFPVDQVNLWHKNVPEEVVGEGPLDVPSRPLPRRRGRPPTYLKQLEGRSVATGGREKRSRVVERQIDVEEDAEKGQSPLEDNLIDVGTSEEERICQWKDCGEILRSTGDLVGHIHETHLKYDNGFRCSWEGCERSAPFRSQYLIVLHLRQHTGEKPKVCPFESCGKSYSRLENLRTHVRAHKGERPFMCNYENCGKSFNNASDRNKHQNRTHSNEKEYECQVEGCTKCYTDPSSLRKHIKNVHGEAEFEKSKKKRSIGTPLRRRGRPALSKASASSSQPPRQSTENPIPIKKRSAEEDKATTVMPHPFFLHNAIMAQLKGDGGSPLGGSPQNALSSVPSQERSATSSSILSASQEQRPKRGFSIKDILQMPLLERAQWALHQRNLLQRENPSHDRPSRDNVDSPSSGKYIVQTDTESDEIDLALSIMPVRASRSRRRSSRSSSASSASPDSRALRHFLDTTPLDDDFIDDMNGRELGRRGDSGGGLSMAIPPRFTNMTHTKGVPRPPIHILHDEYPEEEVPAQQLEDYSFMTRMRALAAVGEPRTSAVSSNFSPFGGASCLPGRSVDLYNNVVPPLSPSLVSDSPLPSLVDVEAEKIRKILLEVRLSKEMFPAPGNPLPTLNVESVASELSPVHSTSTRYSDGELGELTDSAELFVSEREKERTSIAPVLQ